MQAAHDTNIDHPIAGKRLAAGLWWLRFSPGMETEFRLYQRELGLPQLRVALVLGFLFGTSFLILDYFLGAAGFSNAKVPLRYALNQVCIIIMFGATFFAAWRPHLDWLGVLVCLNLVFSSLLLTSVGQAQAIGTPYAGFLMLIFYTYFFVGLRFWTALGTATAIVVSVISTLILRDMPLGTLIYNSLFLIFANLVGATGAYNIEYNRRQSFLEARALQKLAGSDPLTGLANRGALAAHLDRTWRNAKRTGEALAVAMVDIDHFKQFNDRYGHQAGDDALVRVATVVREVGNRPLDLAGRYGGEEFVLVLPGCTLAHARERLQNLRRDVEDLEIEHLDSAAANVLTISAGLAQVYPQDTNRSADGLVQMADHALYSAKQQGRNQVVVAAEDPNLQTGPFHFQDLRIPT